MFVHNIAQFCQPGNTEEWISGLPKYSLSHFVLQDKDTSFTVGQRMTKGNILARESNISHFHNTVEVNGFLLENQKEDRRRMHDMVNFLQSDSFPPQQQFRSTSGSSSPFKIKLTIQMLYELRQTDPISVLDVLLRKVYVIHTSPSSP